MATRTDNSVTLSHTEASAVAKMLGELATSYADHSRRSRSPAVKEATARWATEARAMATAITEKLWTWK